MIIDTDKLSADAKQAAENAANQAGAVVNSVLKDSNTFVQQEGPAVVTFIKKYWWVGVGVVALLVYLAFQYQTKLF